MVLNRRGFVSSLAAAGLSFGAEKGQLFSSEIHRFADSATEFDVFRLTDPKHQSFLPTNAGRAISHRSNFLIHASDRAGSMQAYRMDLKNGQSRSLTDATKLMPESLVLAPDERSFSYFDDGTLVSANLSTSKTREVYHIADGFEFGQGFNFSDDGLYAALVEKKPGVNRLRLINMRNGDAVTLSESSDPVLDPMPRPKRAGILYRRGEGELWIVNFDGAQNRKLRTSPGSVGAAVWSSDGRTALYLNFPPDRKQLNNIRECTPDTNEDKFVSSTSQFVAFNRNSDSSVLVGASGSKASPFVLLLVRSVRRELTLCEHRCSDPSLVTPVFSPNSQRVLFQSDRDGKMAIYAMVVERLVEETETDEK